MNEVMNVDDMEKLSLKELEQYGTNIQSEIDTNCTNLLNSVTASQLGDTGEKLENFN